MTLSEYRSNASWQGAIKLGPELMRLAEELPGSEEMGLSLQLRQSMVDLPAAVAVDLATGSATRHTAGFRLLATLELIDHVYPALDTAAVRADADKLVERFTTEAHPTTHPAHHPAAHHAAPAAPATPPTPPAETPVVPGEVVATPAPVRDVSAIAPAESEHHTEPESVPAAPTVVPVLAAAPAPEEAHVHPDSVQ